MFSNNEQWLAAQPNMQKVYADSGNDPMAWKTALESWQNSNPANVAAPSTAPLTMASTASQTGTGERFTIDNRPIDHSFVSLSEYQNAQGQPHTAYQGLNYDAAGGSRINTPTGERYFSPYAAQPTTEYLDYLMAQPSNSTLNAMNPMDRGNALETWQKSRPGYVDPMNYDTFENYISAANPGYRTGKDEGNDLQNRANFYGLTTENYNNVLSGDMTRPMGENQSVYGAKLLSPLERIAAETARAQGLGTMNQEVSALARENPNIFNAASEKYQKYLTNTFPGTLEYQNVLSGPMQFSTSGVKYPTTQNSASMYIIDPRTKQIVKNPNYRAPGGLSTLNTQRRG